MNKVIRIFLESDLRCQHNGLAKTARKHGVDVNNLGAGEHVLFVNRAKNKLKMYSPGDVLAYLRLSKGTLDVRTLSQIPKTYGKTLKVQYDKALGSVLTKEFAKKKQRSSARQ